MLEDETNTPDQVGTDNVETVADDTVQDWDYYDPDDDQDNAEPPADGTIESDVDGIGEAAQEAEVSAEATHVVTLPGGEKTTVAELIKGQLRQADYTRKSQEVANERQAMAADLQRIEGITSAFIDHLTGLIPAAPDPALAYRDPTAHYRQKVAHEAALAKVQELIELGKQPKAISTELSDRDKTTMLAEENRKLVERVPEVATEQGRQKFFSEGARVAQEIGFTMDELSGVTDHRLFVLLHHAKIGMDAMKARAAAKAKVQSAPPMATGKPGAVNGVVRNDAAMKRLAKSGSLRDAMKVDFD